MIGGRGRLPLYNNDERKSQAALRFVGRHLDLDLGRPCFESDLDREFVGQNRHSRDGALVRVQPLASEVAEPMREGSMEDISPIAGELQGGERTGRDSMKSIECRQLLRLIFVTGASLLKR